MSNFKGFAIFSGTFFMIFMVMLGLFNTSANVTKARPNQYEFSQDTLAASDTLLFAIPQLIKNRTGYIFQVTPTNVSGTTGGTVYLQESCWELADRWVNADTLSFSAAGNYKIEGTTDARRIRLWFQSDTTTQSTLIDVAGQLVEVF